MRYGGLGPGKARLLLVAIVMVVAGLVAPVGPAVAQTETASLQWNVEQLDKLLAATRPGDPVLVDDMFIDRGILQAHRDSLASRAAGQPAPGAASGNFTKWTAGNVYYQFEGTVSAAHQESFVDAAGEWEAFANVHFVARTNQANYITVKDVAGLSGGNSAVGMRGGEQVINIGSGSWNRTTVEHEIGHALGFIHEHQRSDRDSFVTILTANITPGQEGNFVLLPSSTNYGPYDFLSIMHYSRTAFSVDTATKNTIEPKPAYGAYLDQMGRQFFRPQSRLDRAAIATIYGGPSTVPNGVVTNTRDSGPGSLRTAIYYGFDRADVAPGTTTNVQFAIPASDPNFDGTVARIRPTAVLAALGDGTTIDGQTQTTFGGNTNAAGPEVLVSGTKWISTESRYSGMVMRGVNSSIRNMIVSDFSAYGMEIVGSPATGNTISGTYIGTDPAGSASAPNGFAGVGISAGAHGNTVGGTTVAARNVISGNTQYGVYMTGAGTNANVVQGDYLGLTRGGDVALPNGFSGVGMFSGAASNTVGGNSAGARNVISGNTQNGLLFGSSTTGTVVEGNYIGLNAAGTAPVPNGQSGLRFFGGAQSNRVGGPGVGQGNVVSGNTNDGVGISDLGTNLNLVQGNLIGTDPTGTTAMPNGRSGVSIFGSAASNGVGGTAAGAGNTISGNTQAGVSISGTNTTANSVEGNLIGLKRNGLQALGNLTNGVQIYGAAANNVVGGTVAGARNHVSGNQNDGISISQAGTSANRVLGNTIGLATDASAAPNLSAGVVLYQAATGNGIGGPAPGEGNTVAANGNAGVLVLDSGTTGNAILGNAVSANSGLGINLSGGSQNSFSVTANDSGDADTGPNQLQNYPVLSSAIGAGTTLVRGGLNSTANTTFRIELFSSPTADPSGFGEGAVYLGSTDVTTDGAGNTPTFAVNLPVAVPPGQVVTATATDPGGNTSEFSQRVVVAPPGPPAIFGSTWYSDGSITQSGPAGSSVRAYAVGAFKDTPYQLVLATSGCATTVAVLNVNTRFATAAGFIGTTVGQLPNTVAAGTYSVCFRTSAAESTGTGVTTFVVQ